MYFSSLISAVVVATGVVEAGRSFQHVGKAPRDDPKLSRRTVEPRYQTHNSLEPRYLTSAAEKYIVNGSAIPDVDFYVGESYAGLMPITKKKNETDEFYFWFFPSENPQAEDEILIWLNGGPGCSSLEGFLQENGPFLWQYGTYKPVKNPWSWTNLTNVVWVEQPIGTGFSQGTPTATSEDDVAAQFMGFWENFVDTFDLHHRRVFIAGESYAGYYVPYIASAMLDTNNTKYFNVEATMAYDPSSTYDGIADQIPTLDFVNYWGGLFPFNDTYKAYISNMSAACGYDDYMSKYLAFPPTEYQPSPIDLPGTDENGYTLPECDIWDSVLSEITWVNPCFDVYQVATTCPVLWDVLGFPGDFEYTPVGSEIYFNRSDVQAAINAPVGTNWAECSSIDVFVNNTDNSPPSTTTVYPGVIERSKRTIIGHGALDMILLANGTLLGIQNMTWGGAVGFSSKPTDPFYVPYHDPSPDVWDNANAGTIAGAGVMGTTHTERGLTWVGIDLSGHMVPQYAPSASYRHLEFLLGRIDSLSSTVAFSTDPFPQPNTTLGNGTAPPYRRGVQLW
ncbi:putative carboxypeptidase Y [Coleophoma cylindrospora]|uniref:Carboxypeptidase n=1 Tax=Coleophoma cylindrospora TaxID=1849047 RepID=A0A3D8Q8R7_9HELO|nr:putative carboxypeptidase Y [Coleophoma cylindrospora]